MVNRVAITGMGIVSCLGKNIQEVTTSLRNGTCGLRDWKELAVLGYQSRLQGEVPIPEDIGIIPARMRKTMDELSLRAAVAVREALLQSGLTDLSRTALVVSNDSTAEAMHDVMATMREYQDTRYLRTSSVFKSLNSTVSMNLAQAFGVGGLSLTVSSACAGGGHAIGIARSIIETGMADNAIVVGAQETGPYAFAAFDALGVFAKGDDALHASRPFDRDRSGLVPSGGAACIILEGQSSYHGSVPFDDLIQIGGYGFSTSPNLITPSVDHIRQAMWNALADYTRGYDVSYYGNMLIAAHATGTREGDLAEAKAISQLMGESDYYVTATKSLTGHECWMAGVSQVIYTAIQMKERFIAPNPNYTNPDPEMPRIPIHVNYRTSQNIKTALCNAFGFGGTNSSIVLRNGKYS